MGVGPVMVTAEVGNSDRLSEAEAVTVRFEMPVVESPIVKLTLDVPFSGIMTGVVVVTVKAGLVTTVRNTPPVILVKSPSVRSLRYRLQVPFTLAGSIELKAAMREAYPL